MLLYRFPADNSTRTHLEVILKHTKEVIATMMLDIIFLFQRNETPHRVGCITQSSALCWWRRRFPKLF
jgi:hypothetical protein